jgi:DNA-binding MarR family transcriptional regulator
MVIQERSKEVLRRCYEQQFLHFGHLRRYLFKGTSKQNVWQRVADLERAGLVRRERLAAKEGGSIIRLTRKGLDEVRTWHRLEIPMARRLDTDTLEHDALVTSVAFRLAELWDGVWIPERAIKRDEFSEVPDGVFVFNSGAKVAVEVENSIKGRARFLSLLERWRGTSMRLVLYVSSAPGISAALRRYLAHGPNGVPLALVEWGALAEGTPYAWCVKGELDVFRRRSL